MGFTQLEFIFIFLPAFLLLYGLVPDAAKNSILYISGLVFYAIGTWHEPAWVIGLLISAVLNFLFHRATAGRKGVWGLLLFEWCILLNISVLVLCKLFSTTLLSKYGIHMSALPLGISFYTFQVISLQVDLYRSGKRISFGRYMAFLLMFPKLLMGPISRYDETKRALDPRTVRFEGVDLSGISSRGPQDEKNMSLRALNDGIAEIAGNAESAERAGGTGIAESAKGVEERKRRRHRKKRKGRLLQWKRVSASGLDKGLRIFTVGLSMKVLLADQLATLWNGICVSGAEGLTTPVAWLGAITYTMELYFDFWGYSLMAVGLGFMLGIPLPENFNQPYSSRTVSEFWRRWHVTLGNWFRDYVYIPLGGSKKNGFVTCINLLVVWALTGIWHGVGINFMIWSGVLFLLVMLEKMTFLGRLRKTKVLGHLYILLLMPVTWIVFAVTDLQQLLIYLKSMIGLQAGAASLAAGQFVRYLESYWYLLLIGLLMFTPYPDKFFRKFRDKWWMIPILLLLFWMSIYVINLGANDPFLYYDF